MTIESLVEKLGSRDADLRDEAFARLRSYGDDAVPHLINALDDNDKKLYAVELLGELEAREAFARLTELLEDDDCLVRSEALYSLFSIEREKSSEFILKALEDEDVWVRHAAANIIEISDECFREPFSPDIMRLLLDDGSEIVREMCALAIGGFNTNDEIIESLRCALNDDCLKVRLAAAGSLGKHGNREGYNIAIEVLESEEEIDYEIGDMAAEALGNIGDETALEALEFYHKNRCVVHQAIHKLKGEFRL